MIFERDLFTYFSRLPTLLLIPLSGDTVCPLGHKETTKWESELSFLHPCSEHLYLPPSDWGRLADFFLL